MSDFEPLEEGALAQRSDEELVAYVAGAGEAGYLESARRAVGIVTWRQEPLVRSLVAAKVPPDSCDDVVSAAFVSFVESAFDGKVILSARAFMVRIAKRRIADFHRDRERRPEQAPLPGEHSGGEEVWGPEEAVEDETGAVAILDAVERVVSSRNETHRRVIMLYGPGLIGGEDLSGAEVAARMSDERGEDVSVANVQQIWRRFKVDLERELSAGEDGGAPDG
ncbi:MAG: sigma-70 family RNA polymerase sigma factor [Thermoleophilia bacterium]|nr:sigma-70 family RNA polymerase sigma factor [Thermoleophilia bacterium]